MRLPGLRYIMPAATCALVAAGTATAASPTLSSVEQDNRHPTATYSLPGADDATIYFATKPDRGTDGSFLEENVEHLDLLTDDEIQRGQWLDSAQLDPGFYYVMLRASDYDCFGDPSCLTGYSDVLTLAVPKPTPRYSAAVRAYRYLSTVALRLRITPLGERVPYRVCWRLVTSRRKCAQGTVRGYSWNESAENRISIRKRGMPEVTKFVWYVNGRKVAAKRARIPRAS